MEREARRGARRLALRGPVRRARARRGGGASRDPVGRGLARRGHRDRPHRARRRARGLRARPDPRPAGADAGRRSRPVLRRRTAGCTGSRRSRRPTRSSAGSASTASCVEAGLVRASLSALLAVRHAAHLARHRRLADRGRRAAAAAARGERDRRVDARLHGQAHGRLAPEHGRLEHLPPPLLRAAAALLPVRVRAPERDRVEGGAARSGRLSGLEQLEELRRPWIDEVPIACEQCGGEVRRIPEVGDVWLDAGIVPFSTLGWQNPECVRRATQPARPGPDEADLHDHAYWEQWFPADWVSEMREQIRLWFYSQHFMSVALTGRAPYRRVLGYEKMLDENGREMHSSWGNTIEAAEAFERMGADVMRWQYCAQPPDQDLLFGFGPGARDQAQAADALELGQVLRRLREHRELPADVGRPAEARASCGRSTGGSSSGRTRSSARRPRATRRS